MALAQLKPQVMQLRAERAELLTRYQPDSERIRQIDAKLAAAQKILDTEDHLEVSEKSTDVNPLWVTINSNLDQAKAQVSALKASQASITEQVATARQQLTDMASSVVVLDRLQRTVQNAKDAYLSYTRKSEEARAAEALNRSRILNVSVAQPADRAAAAGLSQGSAQYRGGADSRLGAGCSGRVSRRRKRPEDLFLRHYFRGMPDWKPSPC